MPAAERGLDKRIGPEAARRLAYERLKVRPWREADAILQASMPKPTLAGRKREGEDD